MPSTKLPHPCMIREFCRYLVLFSCRRIVTLKEGFSAPVGIENEPTFRLFREVRLITKEDMRSGAKLHVSFSVKRMNFVQKVLIPVLSQPFYVGLPGFRSKRFFLDEETCSCKGRYEWESIEAAQNYINGYATKFMNLISLPGTLRYEIYQTHTEVVGGSSGPANSLSRRRRERRENT